MSRKKVSRFLRARVLKGTPTTLSQSPEDVSKRSTISALLPEEPHRYAHNGTYQGGCMCGKPFDNPCHVIDKPTSSPKNGVRLTNPKGWRSDGQLAG
jgi:hypothetical protein